MSTFSKVFAVVNEWTTRVLFWTLGAFWAYLSGLIVIGLTYTRVPPTADVVRFLHWELAAHVVGAIFFFAYGWFMPRRETRKMLARRSIRQTEKVDGRRCERNRTFN